MLLAHCKNVGLCHQMFAGISASLGAFAIGTIYGWVAPILPHLLSPDSEIPMTPQQASWVLSVPEIANLFTPIPTGIMADSFGRKPLILVAAPLFTIGWIIILYFKTYTSLIIARSFQGASVGIVLTVDPVYLGEIASTDSRGAITSLFFIFCWIGYLFEYCTGPFLSFSNFTFITLATSVVYLLMFSIQPESPYYYLMKGNQEAAYKCLKWFRSSSEESIRLELPKMILNVQDNQEKKISWKEVIASPTDRKALYLILFLASLRIFSGTYAILSYATKNFNITPDLVIPPKYITILLGLVLLVGACCSFFTLDFLGRRPLLIMSSLGSSISLFIAGIYYYLDSETTVDVSSFSWLAPIATLIYAGINVAGVFPVNTAYTSELFNSNTRAIAASMSALMSTFFTFVTLLLYQTFIDLYGVYFNFLLYGTISFIGAIVSYFVMPETKNKTFDQIRNEL